MARGSLTMASSAVHHGEILRPGTGSERLEGGLVTLCVQRRSSGVGDGGQSKGREDERVGIGLGFAR